MISRACVTPVALCLLASAAAAEPCKSGPQTGQRPGPYAFLVSTGPNRGKSHCFICETMNRPAIIVFARTTTDATGKLLAEIDKVLPTHEKAELRAWVTFLGENQPALDTELVKWSRKHALGRLPLGVFEDNLGPPVYRLNPDADVTVLLSVNQKVVANYAFRPGELTEEKVKEVLDALPKILPKP